MGDGFRTESDCLGALPVPADALWGVHTVRAVENFPLACRPVHEALVCAYGDVKLACAQTNRSLGAWSEDVAKADAIEQACRDLAACRLRETVIVDALQGGAGTSTNMNVNEVLANRALQIVNESPRDYAKVSPLEDINLHQSTNDTYPTALKLAAIRLLRVLEQKVVALQESFQRAEKRFADVVKVARTEMQDAVLTTLGREMSAYAEAFSRDRWRIYKCEERLRVINLGGTAIGTGLGAPRQYIFQVVETLRQNTGIGFARAENLVDATQNADVFAEVSGILKAHAVTLMKVCNDLRLMSSGPEAGLGEIRLPARQAGSSIMPGKVNPVIPEAVMQAAMRVMGLDTTLCMACASGNLELNAFMPVIADSLLEMLDLLARADDILAKHCIDGIEANRERCRQHVESSCAMATALLPAIGYEKAAEVMAEAKRTGETIRQVVLRQKLLDEKTLDELLKPESICRLGTPTLEAAEVTR